MSRPTFVEIERSNLRWGLAVVTVAVVVSYMAFIGVPFQGGYEVTAITRSASQVHAGSPVRIAGVNVGKVVGVDRGPGDTAKVRMKITDAGLPLHRDATLKIRPRLFLEGNFFVDVKPGSPSAPEIPDGGTIPLAQTAIPVQFDQVLSALQADTRSDLQTVLKQYARALDRGGAEAIRRSFAPARGAFDGIALAAEQSQGLTRDDLSRFIADGERITTALNRRRTELADLVTSFDRTITALGSQPANVAASTRELAALVQEAYPALADVNAALPALRRLARQLRPLARRAPRTLDLAYPLLVQLNGLLSAPEVPALLRDARPALRALAAVQQPLTGLLEQVTPVSQCVRDNVLPTITQPVDDGALSTKRPVWQELMTSGTGLASAAQNFDGNGPSVRLLAGGGPQSVSSGKLPGIGSLVGTTSDPILGSRPAKPASAPPFRPEVSCITQSPPVLAAANGPVMASRRMAPRRMRKAQATSLLNTLRRLGVRERAASAPLETQTVRGALAKAVGK